MAEEKKWSLLCSYYDKEFASLSELLRDIVKTGMDPNCEITLNGKPIGEKPWDFLSVDC